MFLFDASNVYSSNNTTGSCTGAPQLVPISHGTFPPLPTHPGLAARLPPAPLPLFYLLVCVAPLLPACTVVPMPVPPPAGACGTSFHNSTVMSMAVYLSNQLNDRGRSSTPSEYLSCPPRLLMPRTGSPTGRLAAAAYMPAVGAGGQPVPCAIAQLLVPASAFAGLCGTAHGASHSCCIALGWHMDASTARQGKALPPGLQAAGQPLIRRPASGWTGTQAAALGRLGGRSATFPQRSPAPSPPGSHASPNRGTCRAS